MITYCKFCNLKFERVGDREFLANAHRARHEKYCTKRPDGVNTAQETTKSSSEGETPSMVAINIPALPELPGHQTDRQSSATGTDCEGKEPEPSGVVQQVERSVVTREVAGAKPAPGANLKLSGYIWRIKRQGQGLWFERIPWEEIEIKKPDKPTVVKDDEEVDYRKLWNRAMKDTDRHTKQCKKCSVGKDCSEYEELYSLEKELMIKSNEQE